MQRTLVIVRAYNNADSVPPFSVTLQKAGPIFRLPVNGLKLVANGGTGVYTNYAVAGLVGTGLAINALTGDFSGTPITNNPIPITATVTDSSTATASAKFVIAVQSRLTGVAVQPPPATNNFAGSYQFSVQGNTGAVTWAANVLPAGGVSINAAGLLSWTSSISMTGGAQHNACSVTATDAGTGDTLTIPFVFTLRQAPVILPMSGSVTVPPSVTAGQPMTLTFNVRAGVAPYTLTPGPTVPSWATVTLVYPGKVLSVYEDVNGPTTDGIITVTGTPPPALYPLATQLDPVQFTATDANGHFYGGAWNIQILNPNATQPQQAGSNVGAATAGLTLNFIGAGVTNSAGVLTVDNTTSAGYGQSLPTTTNVGNVYNATPTPAITSYVAGKQYTVTFNAANTSSATLNISGLGAKIIKFKGNNLSANFITANSTLELVYDGTNFNVVSAVVDASQVNIPVNALGTIGAAATANFNTAAINTGTLTTATPCTFTFTAPAQSGTVCVVELTQPGAGSPTTVTWPGSVVGTPPAPNQTLSSKTVYMFFYDGASYVFFGSNQPPLTGPVVTTATANTALNQAAWNVVFVNANALTITLPGAPNAGDEIDFLCAAAATSLTLNPNALKIETTAGNMTCDLKKPNGSVMNFSMVYTNAAEGWSLI